MERDAHTKALSLLAEMEERASKATTGPWGVVRGGQNGNCDFVVAPDRERAIGRTYVYLDFSRTNAAFIASVRTDAPRAYRALRLAVAHLQNEVDEDHDDECEHSLSAAAIVRAIAEALYRDESEEKA